MRKFLALVLALVMTMSLVTISAGAEDFADDTDINYDAAVAVISAIDVMDGYTDGSFGPDNGLTRGAAAKIICNMILGPTTAAELNADTDPFIDVDQDSTFAGYIAYCAKEGIVGGYADGTFKPSAPLTGYAFMKMLLGALGYDADVEGYTGANWSINVAKQAIGIGLNAGLKTDFNGSDFVTREEAALYAFNTLQATMVEYDTVITVGDLTIAGSEAKNVAQTGYKDTMDAANLQFAEKYFTKLSVKPATDDFERPANTWINNKKEIGTYVDYTQLVESYTVAVDGKDLYNALGSNAIKESGVAYYVDGEVVTTEIKNSNMIKTNTQDYASTGNGVLTEVYYDVDADEIVIVSINTYFAEVTADYHEKKETLYLNVFGVADGAVTLEEVAGIEEYKDGDYVLVNVAKDEIVAVFDPELTATDAKITKYSTDYIVAEEQYDFSENKVLETQLQSYNNTALTNYTYNVYLDQYGYAIAVLEYAGQDNYLFLAGYDLGTSHLSVKTAEAAVIFLDGTMSVVDVKVADTNANITAAGDQNYPALRGGDENYNKWFTYTEKNGVYTLTPAENWLNVAKAAADDRNINCQSARLTDGTKIAYGNDDSVYLTVDVDAVSAGNVFVGIDEVTGVYTGIQDVDLDVIDEADNTYFNNSIFVVYDDEQYIIGAVVLGEDASSTENYAYAVKGAQNEYVDADDNYYWDFKAIVDGAYVTLTVKDEYTQTLINKIQAQLNAPYDSRTMFKLTYDKEGFVVDAELVDNVNGVVDSYYTDYEFSQSKAIDDYKIYDVEHRTAGYTATLRAVGKTLYVTNKDNVDVGLTIAADAPVVLIQETETGMAVEEYTTIAQALKAVEDASAADGLQLDGFISAALNENGTAKYLVLKSTTMADVVLDDGSTPNATNNKWDVKVNTLAGLVDATCELATAGQYPAVTETKTQIATGLQNAGYVVSNWGNESVSFASGNRTITVVDPDLGVAQTFTVTVNWA